jgi:putative glutamine amidotransferase
MQPLVVLPTDVRRLEGYRWHAVTETYIEAALSAAGVLPLLLPSAGAGRIDLDTLLESVDGVLLTGSKSNVDPTLYGRRATRAHEPFDRDRDATTLPLIRAAIGRGVPLLAICRGMQELNVALGGTLANDIHGHEGNLDHRAPKSPERDERYGIRQEVRPAAGGCLATIVGAGDFRVNSLHRQAIDRLADGLTVEARAPDGVIEAVSVTGAPAFAVGVQWHPEYWSASDERSSRLFKAFGDAARARRQARKG